MPDAKSTLKPRKNFAIVQPHFIKDLENKSEIMLYITLAKYADANGHCFVSNETLSKESGIYRKNLYRIRSSLEDKGYIKVIGKKNRSTFVYQIFYEKIVRKPNETRGL